MILDVYLCNDIQLALCAMNIAIKPLLLFKSPFHNLALSYLTSSKQSAAPAHTGPESLPRS